jgi:hypothetical protein
MDGPANEANASVNIIMFLFLNTVSLNNLLEMRLNKNLLNGPLQLVLFIALSIFVYFKSIRHNQFLNYEKLFEGNSKNKRIVGTIGVAIYCLFSLIFFFHVYGH